MFLPWRFLGFELVQRGQQRARQLWGLHVGLVRARLSSAVGPWSKPASPVDVSAKQWGRSKLPWRFPATTDRLRGKRRGWTQKTYEDHRSPFRDGLFCLSGTMTGLHQPTPITLLSGLFAGAVCISSAQAEMNVIFVYNICGGRQNA